MLVRRCSYFRRILAMAISTVGPKTNSALMVMNGENSIVRMTQPTDDLPRSAAIEAGSQM